MQEQRRRSLSATTKFYAGFCLALAVVIAVAFALGFQAGARSHAAAARHRPASVAAPAP